MKHILRICLLGLLAGLMVACGGSDDPTPTEEQVTSTPIVLIVTATPNAIDTDTPESIATETEIPTEIPTDIPIPTSSFPRQQPSPARIAFFTTTTSNVNVVDLSQRTARVSVSWQVDNRPNNTNLKFEQVLSNGAVINVELPRSFTQVPSSGSGQVAPFSPLQGGNQITLRVRLVNNANDQTIDSRQMTLPVIGYDVVYDYFDVSACYASPFLPDAGLTVGGSGYVTQNVTVGLPISTSSRFIGNVLTGLPAGERFTVLEGPTCFHPSSHTQATYRLWRIRTQTYNTVGWVHEYSLAGVRFLASVDDGFDEIVVNTFTVEPLEVNEGEPITVTWDVDGVDGIHIMLGHSRQRFGWGQINPNPLPSSGSYTFDAPRYVNLAQITLTGIVDEELGQGGTLEGSFDVAIECLHDWFVTPVEPHPYCPENAVTSTQVAYQAFENGFMLWHNGLIWSFVNGGDGFQTIDTWNGQEIAYSETPPAGRFLPQNGFGWEWVNNTELRNDLGWATASEQGYSAQFQNVPGTGWIPDYYYISLPDGRVVPFRVTMGRISWNSLIQP